MTRSARARGRRLRRAHDLGVEVMHLRVGVEELPLLEHRLGQLSIGKARGFFERGAKPSVSCFDDPSQLRLREVGRAVELDHEAILRAVLLEPLLAGGEIAEFGRGSDAGFGIAHEAAEARILDLRGQRLANG